MQKRSVMLNILRLVKLYIRLHEQKIKTVSIYPHYHPTTRKKANYNILNEIPCLAPYKKKLLCNLV